MWILVDMTDKTQHTDRRKLWQVQNKSDITFHKSDITFHKSDITFHNSDIIIHKLYGINFP